MKDIVEVWRDIENYEGLYQISSLGRVRSLNFNHTGQVMILKARKNRDGYLRVDLCKNGKRKDCRVHRLVATAFIPNPDSLPEVNHKDERKENCRLENLEWVSHIQNINHASRNQRVAEKLSKQIAQYTLGGVLVAIYPSIKEAAKQTGFSNGNICNCCNEKLKTYKGYIWRYV